MKLMKMIKKYIAIITIASSAVGISAFAEDGTSAAPTDPTQLNNAPQGIRVDARENIERLRKEAQEAILRAKKEAGTQIKDLRDETKKVLDSKRQELKGVITEKREDAKEAIKEKREALREDITAKREEIKNKIEDERAKLKERLQKVKDERKKKIVEQVAEQINKLNDRMVEHFLNLSEKLKSTLSRIEDRMNKVAEKGIDIASVKTAIETAKSEIAKAETAIKAQSEKTYAVNVTSEDNLRADVGAARELFRKDIEVVKNAMDSARKAVRDAATTLAKLARENKDKVEDNQTAPVNNTVQ